jgi:hypothetical protein
MDCLTKPGDVPVLCRDTIYPIKAGEQAMKVYAPQIAHSQIEEFRELLLNQLQILSVDADIAAIANEVGWALGVTAQQHNSEASWCADWSVGFANGMQLARSQ